ncbi:MarR family winged helix-turn-helix transcriptional regulator [Cellulomonas sp. P22]|uniref:MarR family winged helix-turn-helix transcriptional regulator n=1 Tax=Cellulomonas sp. P22 TaxID=3373189 RepID=UPI0037AD0450
MPHEPAPVAEVTRSLLDVLNPIVRRMNLERTLSAGKVGILRHLVARGRATTAELAVAVHVSPQGVSLAARELERMGCVARIPDEEDRRKVWIVVTDAGRDRFAQESWVGHEWLDRAIAERLTDEETRTLEAGVSILRKITAETIDD